MGRRSVTALVSAGALVALTGLAGCGSSETDATSYDASSPSASESPEAAGESPSETTTESASPTPSRKPSPKPPAKPSQQPARGTVVTTAPSDFGPMLFGPNRQAIYIWELEETSTAECYDDCAVAWPPVLTEGRPRASGDVDPDLLGTTRRADGSRQVTYAGHPLYYYAHEGPGEVKCHNVSTHGGLWWVVQPDGDRAP